MKCLKMLTSILPCSLVILLLPLTSNVASFNISIDTRLQGMTGALAFDSIDGDGLINNTVTISNFTTDAILSGSTPTGDISGTLSPGPLVIGDAEFFNEWLQTFTFGTDINFRLQSTTSGPFTQVPDSFSFFLLDSNLFPYATSDPLGTDALVIPDIDSAGPQVQPFLSTSATVRVSPVPLPGALVLFLSAGLTVIGIGMRRSG